MIIEKRKTRSQKLYAVGYLSAIDKYVLEVVVTWIAWYNRYYEISEEEYSLFDTDVEKLDQLAHDIDYGIEGENRFLFSDRTEENSTENQELYDKCREKRESSN